MRKRQGNQPARKRGRIYLALLSSALFAQSSGGNLSGLNLSGVFSEEGRIAVADISDAREQFFEHEGMRLSCGWAYTAEVSESLIGGVDKFNFIVTSGDDPLPGGRYLIFGAPSQKNIEPQPQLPFEPLPNGFEYAPPNPVGMKKSSCWRRSPYFTHSMLQMVFKVLPECNRDGTLCVQESGQSILRSLGLDSFKTTEDGNALFYLDDIRKAVAELMSPSKKTKTPETETGATHP